MARSLPIHRAERTNTAKHFRFLQSPYQFLLLLPFACDVELHAGMFTGVRAACVLHHAVLRLEAGIYFNANLFPTATGYSVEGARQAPVANTNGVAAVVGAVGRRRVCRIEPAPMKPIPGIICAAMRVWSPVCSPASASDRTVNSAAPKQINMLVRRPAGLCLTSRSIPMIPPRNAASTSRARELETMPLAISPCNKPRMCC